MAMDQKSIIYGRFSHTGTFYSYEKGGLFTVTVNYCSTPVDNRLRLRPCCDSISKRLYIK